MEGSIFHGIIDSLTETIIYAMCEELILKQFAREALESRLGDPLRNRLDRLQMKRAKKIVQFAVHQYGWSPLSGHALDEIRREKQANQLYLLGSGSSVNQIPLTMWQEIRDQVSIGINHWTLHEFIPDIYAVETVPDNRRTTLSPSYPLEINHLNHLKVLDRPAIYESSVSIWCLAPRSHGENVQLLNIPRNLASRTYVYYRFTPVTRKLSNLSKDLKKAIQGLNSQDSCFVLPDSGASLIRLMILGLVSGFREVVLVGVDLSTSYFWQEQGASIIDGRFELFEQPMKGDHHETLSKTHRPFSVVEMVQALKELYEERGVGLRVEAYPSKLSALFGSEPEQ